MIVVNNTVMAAVLSAALLSVVAKTPPEPLPCALNVPANGSRDVYCDAIPYEVDLSRVGDVGELDVSRNGLHRIRLISGRNVTLSALDLSHNVIQSACHVVAGPAVTVASLVLSANKVRRFSACFTADLKNLTLDRNRIKSLARADTVNASSLRVLDLGHNTILWIENGTFAGMPELQWLDLRGNVLARLSAETLPGAALLHLDVSENYDLADRSAAAGAFDPFENLVELNIAYGAALAPAVLASSGRRLRALNASHTDLTRVPVAPAPLLATLILAGNAITAVNSGDLDGYPLLRALDISGNRIGGVEDDAFGRLGLLAALDLSGNLLETVPAGLPAGLRTLNLEGNRIRNLSADAFDGCGRTRALNVRGNGVRHIQDSALAPMPFLDVLDLSDNPIRMITREMVTGPARLTTLILEDLDAPDTPAFPFIDTRYLNRIRLARSRHLAATLLNDAAVLASMTQLEHLDLTGCAVTSLPDRLPYYMPKLRALTATELDCDSAPSWLGDWLCEIRASEDAVAAAAGVPPHARLRLRSFRPPARPAPPVNDVRCLRLDGRTRPAVDERRCAAIATTTTTTTTTTTPPSERFAVFARLSGTAADARDPRAPGYDPGSRASGLPGSRAAIACVSLLLLLLALSACGTVLIGARFKRRLPRWRRRAAAAADVDYQSIEIKSMDSLNRVERW